MATQLFQFTPRATPHYTLAETQSEKDEELRRKLAQIEAQNSGAMAQTITRANYDQANQNADRFVRQQGMEAAQEQNGVANDMEQQKIDATLAMREQQQARLGAQDARQAENDKRILEQQGFQNSRLRAQDERAAIENQRKDAEYSQEQKNKDIHNYYSELGRSFMASTPDKNGDVDVTGHKSVFEQGLGGKLPADAQIKLRPNAETGNYDLYGIGEDGTYTPITKHEVPVSFGKSQMEMAISAAKADMGIKPEPKDLEVIYDQKLGPDGMTLVKTPVSVFDKKSGKTVPYNAAIAPTTPELTPAQKALAALREQPAQEQDQEEAQSPRVRPNLAPKPLAPRMGQSRGGAAPRSDLTGKW
jgi:hypothetical protein